MVSTKDEFFRNSTAHERVEHGKHLGFRYVIALLLRDVRRLGSHEQNRTEHQFQTAVKTLTTRILAHDNFHMIRLAELELLLVSVKLFHVTS
jgi:hypothetical protein